MIGLPLLLTMNQVERSLTNTSAGALFGINSLIGSAQKSPESDPEADKSAGRYEPESWCWWRNNQRSARKKQGSADQ